MRGIEGEQVLLRLILSESRTHDGAPLYRKIVEMLRGDGVAGATVLKGVAGFGHDRRVHSASIEVAAEVYRSSWRSWTPRRGSTASRRSWRR
jgi:PII-like signaling protein